MTLRMWQPRHTFSDLQRECRMVAGQLSRHLLAAGPRL